MNRLQYNNYNESVTIYTIVYNILVYRINKGYNINEGILQIYIH